MYGTKYRRVVITTLTVEEVYTMCNNNRDINSQAMHLDRIRQELYEFEYVDPKTDLTHKLTDKEREALYKVFQCRSRAMVVNNLNVEILHQVAENTIRNRL